MPESIWFLGIGFRSESHLYWFQGSMTFAMASLALFAYCVRGAPSDDTRRLATIYWAITLVFHALASITASVYAYKQIYWLGKSPNGPLFSLDCIWFNAMMTVVYVGLIAVLRRTAKRAPELETDEAQLMSDEPTQERPGG